jgi:ATP-binding cassette subfamily C protein LapB
MQGWLDAVLAVAAHYQIDTSRERLRVDAAWAADGMSSEDLRHCIRQMAQQAGLAVTEVAPDLTRLTAWRLPVAVQLRGGQVAVVTALTEGGLRLLLSGDEGGESTHTLAELQPEVEAMAVLRPLQSAPDSRVDSYLRPVERHWLRDIVFADLRPYGHILLASFITNLMALGGILFSMQVYDRVVPSQSEPTLYVLFGGVLLSIAFAWAMRAARMHITDMLGKRADLRISDRVFGHALRVKNSARPRATGTFVAQIRELEPVREMLTSTTAAAVADLPFFLLFCFIFWMIAGSLVWVPLAAFVLLLAPSLLAQKRLRNLAQASMRESALRNAMLVETVQGIEDIKLLQAEPRFQNQWNHYNVVNAESGLKLRALLHHLSNWMQTVQGSAFAFVVFFGAPQVMRGEMSTGVLVASSILVSRMLAPLSSVTGVLNRWQQAKMASDGWTSSCACPWITPRTAAASTALSSRGATTSAKPCSATTARPRHCRSRGCRSQPVSASPSWGATGGQVDAAAGAIGSDRARERAPAAGRRGLAHIDPADVRRDVGLLTQNARLFYGSLRENLLLGAPHASDAELMTALLDAGAWSFVQTLPTGLDHMVMEGGLGLSGAAPEPVAGAPAVAPAASAAAG